MAGGTLVHYAHWRVIFFINIPIGLIGLALVLRYLPDYREETRRELDAIGLVLFGGGVALMSYVLEVFGEHTLSMTEMGCLMAFAVLLLAAYWAHARRTPQPLLDASLFSVRTFRCAISGSFLTRLGAGGVAFLLPMLYQVGLGLTPVQSGLLMMPQALTAYGRSSMDAAGTGRGSQLGSTETAYALGAKAAVRTVRHAGRSPRRCSSVIFTIG